MAAALAYLALLSGWRLVLLACWSFGSKRLVPTVNEFHGTFAVAPDGNISSLENRTSKSSKFTVLVT